MLDLLSQDFVLNALKVSLIMGLLLSYLGVHVVGRGIVFVDLALGQISMLGVAFGNFIEQDSTVVSIIFTMAGAFLLSFINIKDKRLKQEAIIGIIYAVASAATVLFIAKTPHGESDISEVLFGSLFTVTPEQILRMAIVFGIIAIVQIAFRKKFFALTEMFEQRENEKVGLFNPWNFLFYLSIGLSIVLAVRAGGVIPVFSYLIIPAVSALMLGRSNWSVVVIALVVSTLGGVFGLWFALHFDFPAGSSIVAMLGAVFGVVAIIRGIKGAPLKSKVAAQKQE
ncbi:MAG TPA: metal ABC transporter permease [Bacteroidota bacterium]|jgi:zinc/manganese transport system permease protein|nr:metal ABC transporter permease [Bacteroidota bacterium]